MLKELAREIAWLFNPPHSPDIEALWAASDSFQNVDWDEITQQRQNSLWSLNRAGLVALRFHWCRRDEATNPIAEAIVVGTGAGWTKEAEHHLSWLAKQVTNGRTCGASTQTSKIVGVKRTEPGRQLVVEKRLANINLLHTKQPPHWYVENEWACGATSPVAVASAVASVGDINVTVNPQIVVNQPAPVVNVHVSPAASDATLRPPTRPKGDTSGTAEVIIAGMRLHHKYEHGGIGNWEPIGVRELAEQVGVGKTTVSEWITTKFGSHDAYKACCRSKTIGMKLQQLSGETPSRFSADRDRDEH